MPITLMPLALAVRYLLGKSYHFISRTLSTKSELIEILAKFILLHPISDKSWAAHQIIEDSASLRISENMMYSPTFVQYI